VKRILIICFLPLALAACQTTAERQAAQLASAQSQCAGFGFQKGTPEHSRCTQGMFVANRQQETEDNARAAEGLQAAARSLQSINPGTPPAAPTTTNCQNLAGMLHCNTF
jgi:hypothetical protein